MNSLQAFREDVRSFMREQLPPVVREKIRLGIELNRAERKSWDLRLRDRGWLTPSWPTQWGGPGWTPAQREAFQEELALNHAPEGNGLTFEMIGPVLIKHGTPAQQQRHPAGLSIQAKPVGIGQRYANQRCQRQLHDFRRRIQQEIGKQLHQSGSGVELPIGEEELRDHFLRNGVKVTTGRPFFPEMPPEGKHHIRLSISTLTEGEIETGFRRLGEALVALPANSSGRPGY